MSSPPASVVLIEDSRAYARLVELHLDESFGAEIEVRHFERLADGAAHLERERADCVLLDLNLPDARGLETLSRVRLADGATPVVILSGCDDESLAASAVAGGAAEFILKGNEARGGALTRAVRRAIGAPSVAGGDAC